MEPEEQEIIYDDPDRCVKDDLEALGPCSCPKCIEEAKQVNAGYIPKGVVLTDANIVSDEAQHRIAFHFKCTACGGTNIADYMRHCPDCGRRVIIRSHKVIEFLKNYTAQMQNKG